MAVVRRQRRQFQKSTLAVSDLHHGGTDRPWRPGITSVIPEPSATRFYTVIRPRPLGDTGVPFIENDAVLGDVDEHFGGDYHGTKNNIEDGARAGLQHGRDRQSRSDASVSTIHDRADRPGLHSIVIDDSPAVKRAATFTGNAASTIFARDVGDNRPAARRPSKVSTFAQPDPIRPRTSPSKIVRPDVRKAGTPVLPPVDIVDHDRMQAGTVGAVGMVEQKRRTDLADRGRC